MTTTKPLDLYRAQYADHLRFIYGDGPMTDAQTIVAIATDIRCGMLTLRELREVLGDVPMSLDELLHDAAKEFANPKHRALVVFCSRAEMKAAVERHRVAFTALGGVWKASQQRWGFESGATIEFGVIEKEGDELRFIGMAWNWLGFHAIESLNKGQIGVFLSRVRPPEGTTRTIRW